jgi:hypothetical protein
MAPRKWSNPATPEKIPMYALLSLTIPFVLVHHGLNNIALKLVSEIKSGAKYWRKTSDK